MQAEAMSRTQGSEITHAMEEQKELERRFEGLVAARAVLRTMPNKNKLKEVGARLISSDGIFFCGLEYKPGMQDMGLIAFQPLLRLSPLKSLDNNPELPGRLGVLRVVFTRSLLESVNPIHLLLHTFLC